MTAKPDKKEAILEAMLNLIVERGFHDAPMSVLAKRSGASAGVIYHYFPSKDDLIHALYLRVKSIKVQSLLEGYVPGMSPHDAFIHLWTNAYRFYREHLRETRFLDQYENSPFCAAAPQTVEEDNIRIDFQKQFRSRKAGGILNDLPPEVVHELSFGLAARLAKKTKPLSRASLKQVAEIAWIAITDK
jgi:AcrR family transcriptional regulator